MKRRVLVIGIILSLAGWIGLAARGAIEDAIVEPLLLGVWVSWQILDSLPQAIIWAGLLVLLGALTLRAALGPAGLMLQRPASVPREGRIDPWRRLFLFARRDRYSRWRVAQRMAGLVMEQIALREQVGVAAARGRIEAGALALSDETLLFLRAGLVAHRLEIQRGAADPLGVDPAHVVAEVERLLETL